MSIANIPIMPYRYGMDGEDCKDGNDQSGRQRPSLTVCYTNECYAGVQGVLECKGELNTRITRLLDYCTLSLDCIQT